MGADSDIRPKVSQSLTVHGDPLGETVVLVHGSMDRQAAFARTLRHVRELRAYTYDRRGYAKSDRVPGPFTVATNVDDLIEVIESIGTRVRAVGHSFGGTTVLAAACRRPDLFDAVAVYESPMSWEPWWPRDTGGALAAAKQDDPEGAAEMFLKRFIGDDRWNRLPESTKQKRRSEGRALVGELSDLRKEPAYDLKLIKVPVLSAVGGRAGEHVRRGAEFLAERCSPSPLVVLDNAWHNAPSSSPEAFAEAVIRPLMKLAY